MIIVFREAEIKEASLGIVCGQLSFTVVLTRAIPGVCPSVRVSHGGGGGGAAAAGHDGADDEDSDDVTSRCASLKM